MQVLSLLLLAATATAFVVPETAASPSNSENDKRCSAENGQPCARNVNSPEFHPVQLVERQAKANSTAAGGKGKGKGKGNGNGAAAGATAAGGKKNNTAGAGGKKKGAAGAGAAASASGNKAGQAKRANLKPNL